MFLSIFQPKPSLTCRPGLFHAKDMQIIPCDHSSDPPNKTNHFGTAPPISAKQAMCRLCREVSENTLPRNITYGLRDSEFTHEDTQQDGARMVFNVWLSL